WCAARRGWSGARSWAGGPGTADRDAHVPQRLPHALDREPAAVLVRGILEAIRHRSPVMVVIPVPELQLGTDDIVVVELERVARVVCGNHQLVQLLSRTDADLLGLATGSDRLDQVDDAHRWDLGNEQLAAVHGARRHQHEIHALLERDPETGHPS